MAQDIIVHQFSIIIHTSQNQAIESALEPLSCELVLLPDLDKLYQNNLLSGAQLLILDDINLCSILRDQTKMPIILISDDIEGALNAGADDCLPFHPQLIIRRVKQFVMTEAYYMMYDHVPAMMHITNEQNTIIYANPSWLQVMGYDRKDVIGYPMTDFMSEVSQQVAPKFIETFRKTGQSHQLAFRYRKKNGEEIDALVDRSLLEQGHMLSILRDITELKVAEQSLKESRNELASILRALPDAVVVVNKEGQYINIVSEDQFSVDLDAEKYIGKSLNDTMPQPIANQILMSVKSAIASNVTQQTEYTVQRSNEDYTYQLTASAINQDDCVLVIRDVTLNRKIEATLIESEKSYRRLFENATDAIFVIDVMTGDILQASPQASMMLGYSQQELQTMQIDAIESDQISIHEDETDYFADTNQLTVESQYRRQDGILIDVEISSRVIVQDQQLILISFVRDITERKRTLAEVEKQRNLTQALLDTANILNEGNDLKDVIETILYSVKNIIPCQSANVMQINGDEARIIHHIGYDEGGFSYEDLSKLVLPLTGTSNLKWVIQTKKPLRVEDTTKSADFEWIETTTADFVRSLLTAPIIASGEVIGFVNLDSTQTHNFTAEQETQLMAFANQIAIALQRAEMMQALQVYTDELEKRVEARTQELKELNEKLEMRVEARTQELSKTNAQLLSQIEETEKAEKAERQQRIIAETLQEGIAKLATTLDRNTIFDDLLDLMQNIIPHEASSIMLITDNEAFIVHSRGYDNENIGLRFDIANMADVQEILTTGQPVIINDKENYETWQDDGFSSWIKSVLVVPITINNEVIGIINLDSQHENHFNPDHTEWLITFGEQVGLAIRNARYTTDLQGMVKQRTEELEFEQAQLEAILNGVTNGVMYTDMNRHPQYINHALAELTGFTTDEWLNGDAQNHINTTAKVGENNWWERIVRWLETNEVWTGELELQRKDGSTFDAGLARTLVRDTAGNAVGMVTVVRNISDEKRLAEQKARFITKAAHELRTPIANLKTRFFLMKRRPDKFKEHLQVAESVTNLMQNLVEHLFDLSRFERGVMEMSFEAVNLHSLLQEIIQYQMPQAERAEIGLILELSDETVTISADPFRLTQVITNLIGNALKHAKPATDIVIQVLPQADEVLINVSDQGNGIAPEHLSKLFQPFYQATHDQSGVGLGLAIVKEIVEAHDGRIDVQSHINVGTTFQIYLPL